MLLIIAEINNKISILENQIINKKITQVSNYSSKLGGLLVMLEEPQLTDDNKSELYEGLNKIFLEINEGFRELNSENEKKINLYNKKRGKWIIIFWLSIALSFVLYTIIFKKRLKRN